MGAITLFRRETLAACFVLAAAATAWADPCGMVPPIYTDGPIPIARIGIQKTYVFFKEGTETFVIRPGFEGRADEFGMLIPFPTVPAIRKVPDDIFAHVAAAIDPPEVVVDLTPDDYPEAATGAVQDSAGVDLEAPLEFDTVRVLKQEAVGMYEVAVLEAGSAQALKRWMDDHGYQYPDGMDAVCDDYVEQGWCFVAVKTRVGQKQGVDPQPGQRGVNDRLPADATFDGFVQAMGFRFHSDELVVPMRLSAFNAGDLRNVVYVLADGPQRIESITDGYVVRQLPGAELFRNVTAPLPLRIIGGDYDDIPDWRKESLPRERDPVPHNGLARELFASDLLAVKADRLTHPHEEREKMLLNVGERLGLRGTEIDALHQEALAAERKQVVTDALEDLPSMTLSVIDGDFPREVIAEENLTFTSFEMDAAGNTPAAYDAKQFGPAPARSGTVQVEEVRTTGPQGGTVILEQPQRPDRNVFLYAIAGVLVLGLTVLAVLRRRGGAPPS